jgi:hypothetical protein
MALGSQNGIPDSIVNLVGDEAGTIALQCGSEFYGSHLLLGAGNRG